MDTDYLPGGHVGTQRVMRDRDVKRERGVLCHFDFQLGEHSSHSGTNEDLHTSEWRSRGFRNVYTRPPYLQAQKRCSWRTSKQVSHDEQCPATAVEVV